MSSNFVVFEHELTGFIIEVLVAVGASQHVAASVARVLVDADLRGIDTHGVARLPAYLNLVHQNFLDIRGEAFVSRQSGAVAVVDAVNGFGQPAGELAIREASRLALQFGIGWVTTHNSNHFGIVGYYTRIAAEQGFIAFAGTNSAAVVAPTRSAQKALGTNPLALSVPGASGIELSLDMSTSAVAGGKLEKAIREKVSIPTGWVLTADGKNTTDPTLGIAAGGALLPLGGTEDQSSYKGYGLGLMVEIFASTLVGAPHGVGVGPLTSSTPKGSAQISHFFMVLDPGRFGDKLAFGNRVDSFCNELRGLAPIDPTLPVLVPGDTERETLQQRIKYGIPIHQSVLSTLDQLATKLQVTSLKRAL